MFNSFIKLNRDSDLADHLAIHHPNAFILLYFIAKRARRTVKSHDGLDIGEAHIGDYEKIGLSERQYRTAKEILCQQNIIKIVETNRTRKKSTTGATTKGTKVKLLDSTIWDINSELNDDSNDVRPTTDRRLTDDEQECKNAKNEKNNSNVGQCVPVAAASFEKLKGFGFSEKDIESVKRVFKQKSYGQDRFDHALKFLATKPKPDNPPGFFVFAAGEMPEIFEGENVEENAVFARECERKWKSSIWSITACRSEIEFVAQGCQMEPVIIKYEERSFKSKVIEFIKEKEFIKLELYKTNNGVVA